MGLDNYISVKVKWDANKEHIAYLRNIYEIVNIDEDFYEHDIVYLRKFWALRDDIIEKCCNGEDAGGVYPLNIDALHTIRDLVIYYITTDAKASDIWEKDSEIRQLCNVLASVQTLMNVAKIFEREIGKSILTVLEIDFWDSY